MHKTAYALLLLTALFWGGNAVAAPEERGQKQQSVGGFVHVRPVGEVPD